MRRHLLDFLPQIFNRIELWRIGRHNCTLVKRVTWVAKNSSIALLVW
jgi:hypothetical protein